jgi:hypothetical protein
LPQLTARTSQVAKLHQDMVEEKVRMMKQIIFLVNQEQRQKKAFRKTKHQEIAAKQKFNAF